MGGVELEVVALEGGRADRLHERDVDLLHRPARAAHEMLMAGVHRRVVLADRVAEVDVTNEPDLLEHVEVPVHGREVDAGEAAPDLLEDRLRGRVIAALADRLEDELSLRRDAPARPLQLLHHLRNPLRDPVHRDDRSGVWLCLRLRTWGALLATSRNQGETVSDAEVITAIKEGDRDRLRRVLEERPGSASARDDEGTSALLHAVYRDRHDLVEVLLAARPRIDAFEAAALGDAALLIKRLDAGPALISEWSHDGFTLLHLAAFFGHEGAVRLLLDRGADFSVVSRSPMGVTPLHSAVAGDHAAVARLLVERGADVNARQRGGWTPLHSAAANGDEALVRFLVERGADVDEAQDEGRTAADLAAERGHDELERALREMGTA
jgi:uncharacterized protein